MNEKIDILLVDDREDGLTALEAVLSDPRYNLVKAQSGHDALMLLPQHDFAVILLDVQMPGIDGFETAARIKKQESFRNIPIIFVTAINKDHEYIYKGYGHGAVDYIFKPFDDYILRSKVTIFVDLFLKTKQLEEQAVRIRESERHERYLRLAQLEVENLKRYQNLANSIPHSVWRSQADGTMDYFNHVWTEYTGLNEEQSSGKGWQSAFDEDDLKVFLKTWIAAMQDSKEFQCECKIRGHNGDYRWHLIKAVPEVDFNNCIIAWLGTCTDIHERKQIEQELIRARKDAEAANTAKTHFLANMSHEIRTPLNSILGFTEIMMGGDQEAMEQQRCLSTIKKNGRLLLKVIDEILDLSKVEAGHLEVEKMDVNLSELLLELHAFLQVQAREKRLDFSMNCLTKIPEKVQTDPARFRQILVNLIGNAIKFTDTGCVEVGISWLPHIHNSETGVLHCEIRDSGIGIDANGASELFKPFVQGDGSTTRRFGGTGLGLALSRKFAKALGGNVYLKSSEHGKGSVFAMDITARVSEGAKLITTLQDPEKSVDDNDAKKDKLLLKDQDILVVDDSSDNRLLISHFLKAAGANVDCATDGFDGVNKALEKKYKLVLMDIQMPQLDGYEATARLRQQGYDRPIIALTAHAMKQEQERSLNAGCDGHLTKPIDRRTLVHQVNKYIMNANPAAPMSSTHSKSL